MDETLTLILDKLNKIEGKINKLEEGQARLEEGQARLEEGQAKLEKKIDDNFDLLFSEDNNIYSSLDKRISILEAKF